MSELTPELNLITAQDDDDTADYLTLDLKGSLGIIDGLFSATTGHAHNGAHQGGELQFLDLEVGEDLTVHGTLTVEQTTTLQGPLHLQGAVDMTDTASLVDPRFTSVGGRITVNQTLPAVAASAGKWRYYKSLGAVQISKAAGDPAGCVWGPGAIAGADNFVLGAGDSVGIFCDGTTWTVI